MSDGPPAATTAAKPQLATKKTSSAALSVASDGSGTSIGSGKHSLNHAHTFHPDEGQKKHRDVGEVVAGLFSRKKKGKKGAGEQDYEDGNYRGESRDGPGSEASSLLDGYGDDNGPHRPYSPVHTPVRDRSTENLPETIGARRRTTSPALSTQEKRGTVTPIKTPPRNRNSGGVNAESTTPVKSPTGLSTGSPSRSAGRSRRGGSLSTDLKITPASSGAAPETTVTPPTPTSPPPRGIRGNRSGSLSNTPSKLSQSMTHPLAPTAEGMSAGTPMAGLDDNRGGMVTIISAGDGTNGKSGGGQGANSAGGFFSSMISAAQNAAQNAATTLSNTVASNIVKGDSRNGSGANTPDVGRSRSGTETDDKSKGDITGMDSTQSDLRKEEQPKKRLAVETLGQGELSLGSLGISNGSKTDLSRNGSSTAVTAMNAGGSGDSVEMDGSSGIYRSIGGRGTSEDVSRVPGTSQLNTEIPTTDTPTQRLPTSIVLPPKTPMAEDTAFNAPVINAYSPGYENTTPIADEDREEWIPSAAGDSLKRSGSSRSNRGPGGLGQGRRPRGSSAASSLANHLQTPANQPQPPASPAGSGPGPKITGFAVASKKRNRDFHALFRSVPEDDYLIEDYGCALQKDILLHGRLYVSEGHICFNSNILGWINTLVISFDEVMAIEKKSTALLFPNAIVIQTLHARNVFASFISRDTTYDLLVNIWKISHPGLIPSVAGYTLEKQPENKANGTGDGGKDKSHSGSESEDEYDEDEEGYEDEDDDDEGLNERESVADAEGGFGEMRAGGGSAPNGAAMTGAPNAAAVAAGADGAAAAPGGGVGGAADAARAQDFPGPATHSATDCGDNDLHYERIVCDEYLPGPLGKVYALLFGSQSNAFLTKFLEDQKVMELSIPNNAEWTPSTEAGGKSTRGYSYIRPLPGGIGPKQTKCICTEQLEQMDLERAVSVLVTTQTPDVPSGNQFSVKTRYCLTWGDGSMTGSAAETRLQLNCTVEWTGKSWLKGPIEKGCNDGQITHGKDLTAALKRELEKYAAAGAASKPRGKGGAKGGKKGKGSGKGAQASNAPTSAAAQKAAKEKAAREKEERENAAWGVLLPLKPILGPVVEMVPGGGMGLLVGIGVLLVITCALTGKLPFLRKQTAAGNQMPPGMYPRPGVPRGRYGIYPEWEHSWYAEEQGLWDWLEDRVGLSSAHMGGVPSDTQEERRTRSWSKLNKIEKNQMLNKIGEVGGMGDKEVEEAVKVMEKRLEVLREIVNERKAQQKLARRMAAGDIVLNDANPA